MISLFANQILYPEAILRTSVSIASNLITSVTYLNLIIKKDTHLQNLLNLNDIIEEVGIIKSFIEEKNKLNDNKSKTIDICLENLTQILSQLENTVNNITLKIENHNKLWFHYFRSYNIDNESALIPILISKMKQRFEILIKISSAINK
jgi:hypothetical protein